MGLVQVPPIWGIGFWESDKCVLAAGKKRRQVVQRQNSSSCSVPFFWRTLLDRPPQVPLSCAVCVGCLGVRGMCVHAPQPPVIHPNMLGSLAFNHNKQRRRKNSFLAQPPGDKISLIGSLFQPLGKVLSTTEMFSFFSRQYDKEELLVISINLTFVTVLSFQTRSTL